MSKLRYFVGFSGPGRHRLDGHHDGESEHLRAPSRRHADPASTESPIDLTQENVEAA